MKLLKPLSVAILLFAVAGCTPRPQNVSPPVWNVIQRQDAYSTTLVACTAARIAGVMPGPAALTIEVARQQAAAALDRYRANQLGESEVVQAMARLDKAIDDAGQRKAVEREKANARRLRKAETYEGDAQALAASDAYRARAEAGWLATLG